MATSERLCAETSRSVNSFVNTVSRRTREVGAESTFARKRTMLQKLCHRVFVSDADGGGTERPCSLQDHP